MLQLLAMLKSKAVPLEKGAWGCFVAYLAGTKTSGLWDTLKDLFAECSESKEEEGPPSKMICQENEPSTSSDPLKSTPPTAPSSKIAIPINEGSLHDSGISQEFLPFHEQLPQRKGVYLWLLIVVIVLNVELLFVHIITKSM